MIDWMGKPIIETLIVGNKKNTEENFMQISENLKKQIKFFTESETVSEAKMKNQTIRLGTIGAGERIFLYLWKETQIRHCFLDIEDGSLMVLNK